MPDVRLTLLVTRNSLAWSKWGPTEVGEAITAGYPIARSDGGFIHPDEVREFYPAEIWAAKSAASEARREETRLAREAERREPDVGSPAWFEARWYRGFMFWRGDWWTR